MWYRVELNKDGSAHSCKSVSGQFENGLNVIYVESDSKEGALRKAFAAWKCGLSDLHPYPDNLRLIRERLDAQRAKRTERCACFMRRARARYRSIVATSLGCGVAIGVALGMWLGAASVVCP